MKRCKNFVNLCDLLLSRCVGVAWRTLLVYTSVAPCLKSDTHEGFCSRSMVQGHALGTKLLRVYQRFHEYTSSSGAEFPPRKMLHNIFGSKLPGQIERTWKRSLVCTDTCKIYETGACSGSKPLVCISLYLRFARKEKAPFLCQSKGKNMQRHRLGTPAGGKLLPIHSLK